MTEETTNSLPLSLFFIFIFTPLSIPIYIKKIPFAAFLLY